MSGAALADLAAEHDEIRARLFAWLDATAAGDGMAARAAFEACAGLLLAHAEAEERHLIPLFAARGLESTGCTAAILLADHAKLRRLLGESRARLAEGGAPLPPRARVETILGARMLIELLEHHDQRERAAFFPALDRALDARQRAELYASCARSQASAASRPASPPSSCSS